MRAESLLKRAQGQKSRFLPCNILPYLFLVTIEVQNLATEGWGKTEEISYIKLANINFYQSTSTISAIPLTSSVKSLYLV